MNRALIPLAITAFLLTVLAACEHKPYTPPPLPPAPAGWNPVSCSDFDFPTNNLVGYCYNGSLRASLGQYIRMTFTITGDASQLVPYETADTPPATLRLFLWRAGDNMTCVGSMQQYRWWTGMTNLTAGTHTVTARLVPEDWTDCYGQSGSTNPALFQATLNDLRGIGFTFGGQSFAGHGVKSLAPGVHFHLDSYTIQSSTLKKRRRR